MKLQELLPPSHIRLDIQASGREDAIQELVNLLAETGDVANADDIKDLVLTRERQLGTGIGFGVAIPHAEPGPFKRTTAAFCRLEKAVDFKSPDGKGARLAFLLLTPEDQPALHVRLLARICRLTRSDHNRNQLLNVKTAEEAAKFIAQAEEDYPELTP